MIPIRRVVDFVEERYLAEEFAYLLPRFPSEPDGEGISAAVLGTELGSGRLHDVTGSFLLQGGGGYFNTGQYLILENPTRSSSHPCASPWGLRTRLSNPSFGTGPLEGLV